MSEKVNLPTIIIDTRETAPLSFDTLHIKGIKQLPTIVKKLDEGDYSVVGFEGKIFIERKAIGDCYSSLLHDHDRVERELERVAEKNYEHRFWLVDASYQVFLQYIRLYRNWGMINSIEGIKNSWILKYQLHWKFMKNRDYSADYIARLALRLQETNDEK